MNSIQYSTNKIQLKNGGTRTYYYKHFKNGTKKLCKKAEYEKKQKLKKIQKGYGITQSKHLSEPWFTLISLGLKTVEGRLNKGNFQTLQIGDRIEWTNDDFKPRNTYTKVVGKHIYPSFKEYLEKEGLQKCLPGMPSIEHGLSVYYKYFTKEDEQTYGVVAIQLETISQ
jgi:ASC-1-like (ASCH) protein